MERKGGNCHSLPSLSALARIQSATSGVSKVLGIRPGGILTPPSLNIPPAKSQAAFETPLKGVPHSIETSCSGNTGPKSYCGTSFPFDVILFSFFVSGFLNHSAFRGYQSSVQKQNIKHCADHKTVLKHKNKN